MGTLQEQASSETATLPFVLASTGRNFDLSSRLPITLMMMAVAVTFSPALPMLFPMVTLYLIITYYGDKFHLLRSCCTPPQVRQTNVVVLLLISRENRLHNTSIET